MSNTVQVCNACYCARLRHRWTHPPHRLHESAREFTICPYCGDNTQSGIYVKEHPAVVELLSHERITKKELEDCPGLITARILNQRGFELVRGAQEWVNDRVTRPTA